MMTVSTAEALESLTDLITRSRHEKVAIRSERGDLVYLVSSEAIERDRLAKIEAFEDSCRLASQELKASLAADGITVEEFMADVMKDLQ